MIDFKKIATATAILSLMGTTAGFAMEASQEELNGNTVTIKGVATPEDQQPEYESNPTHWSHDIEFGVQGDEQEGPAAHVNHELMEAKNEEEQLQKLVEQAKARRIALEEEQKRQRAASEEEKKKQEAQTIEALQNMLLEEQAKAVALEKELEEVENARILAEQKRLAAEQDRQAKEQQPSLGAVIVAAGLGGGRSEERVNRNIDREVNNVVNFLKYGKKKKKKHKKGK